MQLIRTQAVIQKSAIPKTAIQNRAKAQSRCMIDVQKTCLAKSGVVAIGLSANTNALVELRMFDTFLEAQEFNSPISGLGSSKGDWILKSAKSQLMAYLKGHRSSFDLPLEPQGTSFQKDVWFALRAIGYGETLSYGDVASRVGRPKAARAVGMANHRNPLAIIIPCHRVIGGGGKMVGYAGGIGRKEALLELEGVLAPLPKLLT